MRALLRRFGRLLAALSAGLVGALPAPPAHAFEDLLSVDVGAGYTLITDAPALTHGGGADLGLGYGFNHVLSARASLGAQALGGEHGVRPAGRLLGELTYAIDVLSVVPSFGLGASLSVVARPDDRRGQHGGVAGGPHAVLSLDYLWSRQLNVGLDLRELVYFGLGAPSFASEARARVSWMFELF
jgi:hypothetical protein